MERNPTEQPLQRFIKPRLIHFSGLLYSSFSFSKPVAISAKKPLAYLNRFYQSISYICMDNPDPIKCPNFDALFCSLMGYERFMNLQWHEGNEIYMGDNISAFFSLETIKFSVCPGI
jgi:hypothetical protein